MKEQNEDFAGRVSVMKNKRLLSILVIMILLAALSAAVLGARIGIL